MRRFATTGWAFKLGKRMVLALAIALIIVAGTVFRQNIENASAAIGTDNLLVNGVPPWMATCVSGIISAGSWLAAQMFGPFGFGFVAAAVLFSLPDVPSFREWRKRRRERALPRPPIEIRFDPSNPGGRFWSPGKWETERTITSGLMYRIEISNLSDKTLVGVMAKFETLTGDSTLPNRMMFVRTGAYELDINPGASEFVRVCLLAKLDKPVKHMFTVRASAKDTIEVVKHFELDSSKTPSVVELSSIKA